jgi:hypothetical protein
MHLLLSLDALQEKKGFFSPTTPLSLSLLEIKKIPTQPKLMAHHKMKNRGDKLAPTL